MSKETTSAGKRSTPDSSSPDSVNTPIVKKSRIGGLLSSLPAPVNTVVAPPMNPPSSAVNASHATSSSTAAELPLPVLEGEVGTVKQFDMKKGFGFITNTSGRDVFVHHKAIQNELNTSGLFRGQPVRFTLAPPDQRGRLKALKVVGVNGEPITGRPVQPSHPSSSQQPPRKPGQAGMQVAIVGCGHGKLDDIYSSLNSDVDLLIICGDFQAVRNEHDLACLACPHKYREMNSFYKYYSGEKKAPVLTIFIGGNHEASNFSLELFYGGWAAPNIYFMGMASVINVGGLRIGGISGIYNKHDFKKGQFELPPFTESSMRSCYHVREYQICQLLSLQPDQLDIMLSHDWPRGVWTYGDMRGLLRKKPFLEKDIKSNQLGNPAAADLLVALRPKHWFSGHMHVRFQARVHHQAAKTDGKTMMDTCQPFTDFLALDKCGPRKHFCETIFFPDKDINLGIQHDVEWLTIVQQSYSSLSLSRDYIPMPPARVSKEQMEQVSMLMKDHMRIDIDSFTRDGVKPFQYIPGQRLNKNASQPIFKLNSQTIDLLTALNLSTDKFQRRQSTARSSSSQQSSHPYAQQLPSSSLSDPPVQETANTVVQENPEEIDLDDL